MYFRVFEGFPYKRLVEPPLGELRWDLRCDSTATAKAVVHILRDRPGNLSFVARYTTDAKIEFLFAIGVSRAQPNARREGENNATLKFCLDLRGCSVVLRNHSARER